MPPPSLRAFLPRADWSSLLASCGTNYTSLQKFVSRTHITKRITALTDYPARAEEFGTRAQVLPLLRCTSALGTQIVAALRLRFRLRKRGVVLKYARTKCALDRFRKRDVVLGAVLYIKARGAGILSPQGCRAESLPYLKILAFGRGRWYNYLKFTP